MNCPKCGNEARDVARFCQRCHMTLRFTCPSCQHEQRHGGTCDQCGVDFLKYIGAVVAGKKAESDATHDRFERRSGLMKSLISVPLDGGFSLVRNLFGVGKKNRN